jgi:lipoprotein-releasing system permease protein
MRISTLLATRYLRSHRHNRFFSWITILSIAGIAIGVAAMIVVLSIFNGYEEELRSRFLAANAHIFAYRFPAGLTSPKKWEQRIKADFPDQLTGTAPFVYYETMARRGSLMQSVMVRGIIPSAREQVQSLKKIIRPLSALDTLEQEVSSATNGARSPSRAAVIVGSGLLAILGAKVGETIDLVSPTEEHFGSVVPFKVVGVYDSGLKHYDNKIIFMSLPAAQRFFNMGSVVTGIEIGLIHPDDSIEIAKKMASKYALSIQEHQSFNRPLFEAMEMERGVTGLIVALIAFVAGFNILTTLSVSVTQKQRDISVLKSLGARNNLILSLFLQQGAIIGAAGCALGAALAWVIATVLSRYQFVDLPDLYLVAKLPVAFDWQVYVFIALSGFLMCLLAGIYPAINATRVDPVEGIRGNLERN